MNLKHRKSAGVTLIELITVVAIVGILASIAIPSYPRYVTRTNRAAARACLSEFSQSMERYYTTNLTYVGAAPVLGCATESNLDQRYTFAVDDPPTPTQRTYRVSATPIGAQLTADTLCGVLTLNQAGLRTEGGTATSTNECW
jgi:type IV pilus assembly protein PilE